MGNLPNWPAASAVYSKAYKALEKMAESHVTISHWYGKSKCSTSEEMDELIKALDKGAEEKIKGLLLLYKEYGYY